MKKRASSKQKKTGQDKGSVEEGKEDGALSTTSSHRHGHGVRQVRYARWCGEPSSLRFASSSSSSSSSQSREESEPPFIPFISGGDDGLMMIWKHPLPARKLREEREDREKEQEREREEERAETLRRRKQARQQVTGQTSMKMRSRRHQ
jgi:hypothetical protein